MMKKLSTLLVCASLSLTTVAQNFDTTGIANWNKRYNSYETWMQGAFDAYRNAADPADFGWGNYDVQTHFIEGDSIYILKTVNGNYKAVSIDRLTSGVFTVTYSDLDGSNLTTKNLDRANYTSKNFFYYSLDSETVKDLEPASANWDIVFTKYLTFFPGFGGYPVSGVLHNNGVQVSQVETAVGATASVSDTNTFPMSNNISTIGYDWKDAFAGVVYDTLTYYVKDQAGNVNELQLTGYGGSGTGIMIFKVNGIQDSVVLGAGNSNQAYYSLANQTEVSLNTDNDWDMAFYAQSSFAAIPIRINETNGAELYVYPAVDINYFSLEEGKTANLISVYPNPANDHINVVTGSNAGFEAQLINQNGAVVRSISAEANSSIAEHKIELGNLSSGVYTLIYNEGNQMATAKVLVTQ